MNVPFTPGEFLDIFRIYNSTVFPMQIFFYLLAAVTLYILLRNISGSNRIISLILSSLWLWMGIIYHIGFFSRINNAAYGFGALYIIQAMLFIIYGFFGNQISYRFSSDFNGILGLLFIFYGLILYPILGYMDGHIYPSAPTFGLPCPTTIFTFGILLWTDKKLPVLLLVVPFLWSVIGFTAAFSLGMYEDVGLLIAGVTATLVLVIRNRQFHPVRTSVSAK